FDIKVAVTPANSQVIYVYTGGLVGSAFSDHLFLSTNGGSSWSDHSPTGIDTGQFGYNTYIFADPTDATKIYIGSRDVWKSASSGGSFVNLTNNFDPDGTYHPFSSTAHSDQHAFTFSPSSSNTLFIGNDGGAYKSTDGGASFASLNASLS